MDTKWNSTAEPAETAPLKKEREQHPKVRAWAAFLAFLLGISLTVGSLGAAADRVALGKDCDEWWASDWQETPAFREQVSQYLNRFLSLGAGREVDWDAWAYESGDAIADWTYTAYGVYSGSGLTSDGAAETPDSPDAAYREDRNILYFVESAQGETFDNLSGVTAVGSLMDCKKLPEGYNFLLIYENGKVSIWKDGAEIDVYGSNRVYNRDSLWCVPGYDNFKADDDLKNVVVRFAVRETPVQYLSTDTFTASYSSVYWLYQSLTDSRQVWTGLGVCCAVGILLLIAWCVLRKERRLADEKIAAVTAYIPTEARFLAVALSLVGLLLPVLVTLCTSWYDWWYTEDFGRLTTWFLRGLCAALSNTAALLSFVWSVWFIHNDHRYNPKEQRRGLIRMATGALRGRALRYPVQKRLNRQATLRNALLVAGFPLGILTAYILGFVFCYDDLFSIWCGVAVCAVLVLLPSILSARRERALARDFGLLADQVAAIRNGEMTAALELPEDADLRATAEQLNAIQSGLSAAVAEQTRSERMKVELISNVSHDLKTPLTSILSYSELLMQEELTGAAADYAKIIQQKALRLKSMVQDVFEISKAASDQLAVKSERLDFTKLLRQTLADMDGDIQQSGLTFKLDLPDTPVEIVADGERLYRVFQNLIQNALNYSLPGSRVHLALKTADNTATASLRNTSKDELPEGVDFTARFVRGDESRTDGGTGLGLSVAKSFTEACGGSFRVETVADLFTAAVSFPLAEAEKN